jgi:hypothetical protein
MWDLTPQTDLVQELPAEYSTESALVDLTVSFLVRIIYFNIWLVTLSDGPLPQPFFLFYFAFLRIMHCKLCGQMVEEKGS